MVDKTYRTNMINIRICNVGTRETTNGCASCSLSGILYSTERETQEVYNLVEINKDLPKEDAYIYVCKHKTDCSDVNLESDCHFIHIYVPYCSLVRNT